MPVFETVTCVTCPRERLFDFLSRPVNAVAVSPPDLNLRLVEAPEQVVLGSKVVVEARRWGVVQRMTTEVVVFEREACWVEEQRQGPFRKWVQHHYFELLGPGQTRMRDRVEFEPPGGLLGFALTAGRIELDLKDASVFRTRRLAALLGADARLE